MKNRGFKLSVIVVLISLGIWIVIAPILAKNLVVEKPLTKADAIMVLSGSSAYIERTQKAAAAYKKGVAKKILLTDDGGYAGWSQKERRNPPFVYLAKQSLIGQGVSKDQIEILSPQVTGTIYEARALHEKIRDENWSSVLLVTSSYHTKRALWTFDEEISTDIELGIVSPETGIQTPPPFLWWLSPRGWRLVGGEYVKFVVYWLFY